MLKFVIGDDAPDNSQIPTAMRAAPAAAVELAEPDGQPADLRGRSAAAAAGETEWLINGKAFDPAIVATSLKNPAGKTPARPAEEGQLQPLGDPQRRRRLGAPLPPAHGGAPHRHAQRQGRHEGADPGHPDDVSREDLVALDPGESVIVYRGFRDFTGPVRGALPQPGARGPRHDVRLGDHLMSTDIAAAGVEERAPTGPAVAGVPWRTVLPLARGPDPGGPVLGRLAARCRRRDRAHPDAVRELGARVGAQPCRSSSSPCSAPSPWRCTGSGRRVTGRGRCC